MSSQASSSSSSRRSSRSWARGSSSRSSSLFDMQATPRSNKSGTKTTKKSQTIQTSEVNRDSWADELKDKISLFDAPLSEFFNKLVPSTGWFMGARPWSDPTEVFATVPKTKKEIDTYDHIRAGLHSLVANFEPQSRPQFADGSRCAVRFPFKAWEAEHRYTMPDVVMSFPGVSEDDKTWMKSWNGISLVFEIKVDQDPIDEDAPWPHVKDGKNAVVVLTQLAKSARNIMLTHHMIYVYFVGIYSTKARIYRFDHAACVASRSFDIKTRPWPLHELLWRFCHVQSQTRVLPEGQPSGSVLGLHPTISPIGDEDLLLVEQHCKMVGKPLLSEEEKKACRWVTMMKYNDEGAEAGTTRYLAFRTQFLNPRLFSRATVVVKALEEGTCRPVVIKDAWRQVARDREDSFYEKIEHAVRNKTSSELLEDYAFMHRNDPTPPKVPGGPEESPEELEDFLAQIKLEPGVGELFGLPTKTQADDLGQREVDKAARRRSGGGSQPSAESGAGSSSAPSSGPRVPAYEVYHRTICGALRYQKQDDKAELDERSHMRLVMKTVGRPLYEFSSTRQLVQAFRDAIIGHRQAYRAGVMHRDVSLDNILIYESFMSDSMLLAFIGFLIDFDYAFDWKTALKIAGWPEDEKSWKNFVAEFNATLKFNTRSATTDSKKPTMDPCNADVSDETQTQDQAAWEARMKIKERTGTLFFMAIEILRTCVGHDVRHDLESFFWLLIWVVLRHTAHSQRSDLQMFMDLFGSCTEKDSAGAKWVFLGASQPDWKVPGNEPLSTLITKFKVLVANQNPLIGADNSPDPIYLTYESVVALFDEALTKTTWPVGDKALPFSLPKDKKSSRSDRGERVIGSKRVRDDAEDDDPISMLQPALKKAQVFSPLRNEVGGADKDDEAGGAVSPSTPRSPNVPPGNF